MSPQLGSARGSLALSLGAVEGALHSKAKELLLKVSLGPSSRWTNVTAHIAGVRTAKINVCPKGWLLEGECPELRPAGMSTIALGDGGSGGTGRKEGGGLEMGGVSVGRVRPSLHPCILMGNKKPKNCIFQLGLLGFYEGIFVKVKGQ